MDLTEIQEVDAASVYQAINDPLGKYKIPYKNLVGFGPSYASVMMG